MAHEGLPHFAMGNSDELAIRLAALVVAGRKTATCYAASQVELETPVGQRWVLEAPKGRPVAVMETVEVEPRAFEEVDEAFARDEGEGDLSLAFWRRAHQDYFTGIGLFAPGMMLNCERFRVIEILDAAFVAEASAHVAAEIEEGRLQ